MKHMPKFVQVVVVYRSDGLLYQRQGRRPNGPIALFEYRSQPKDNDLLIKDLRKPQCNWY